MDCASCGKELKYSGDEGAHLWQVVHLLNHLLAEVSDLVEAFGSRKDGDPGWVLHYIEDHLREIAEGR